MKKKLDNYEAVGICEGYIACDNEELKQEAWQYLIDSGLAWQLQGFFGRRASQLIEEGVCHA